ncbi:bifunctional diaminohydroxyphosphoribosylaminopyrimidine deaminase/5-amino-6-(5-phosphoribosylamino)uracil reductase RibD [Streptacidiphilus griseoplanus]|uniref:bifunctional diaminohydroxyphosphoribosylaminopyrimidine deaminase/5-amino-6-(5-phosphoribosylamino)uracil reductase RibD n=1 Tax=Peterkaempfera griseoplana TaxID=66896 RepID=UPI0006E32FFA|nr:bifunctional diaminohydroxyphosphoribosylaminopyrimidine deaminase/5-amino-6-(5-phosphoribosylamino)uracil reductase RibD [Peterkaempfera griseoplana]
MRRAVALAAQGLGGTSPNPVVGCVILAADGTIAGEGLHHRAGGPHAEVAALRAAGAAAAGGTAVVTLEPCDHSGRTGPCTRALLAAGIRRVVYAVSDPDPTASGGAETLRAAGLEVVGGVLAEEAALGNRYWLVAAARRRPFVTWKYGATLDGRVAAADGSSRWVTGPEARRDAHRLRASHDAVLVGAGTLRTDDPALDLRHGVVGRPPLRVVAASSGHGLPVTARIWDGSAPTLLAVAEPGSAAGLPGDVEVLAVPRGPRGRGVDLRALLRELYARGVRSVLAEGGPTLAGALLEAGLVDEVVGYLAPSVLGAGPSCLASEAMPSVGAAVRFEFTAVTRLGGDLRISAAPVAATAAPPPATEAAPVAVAAGSGAVAR